MNEENKKPSLIVALVALALNTLWAQWLIMEIFHKSHAFLNVMITMLLVGWFSPPNQKGWIRVMMLAATVYVFAKGK